MIRINLINETSETRVEEVKKEMAMIGAPTLRAWQYDDGEYFLIEGSHRATAAMEMGLPITLEIVDFEDIADEQVNDITDADVADTTVAEYWSRLADFPGIDIAENMIIIK